MEIEEIVIPGMETLQTKLGGPDVGQPQYQTLHCLVSADEEKRVTSRWKLTHEETELLISGGSIFMSVMTFGHQFQPTMIFVAREPTPTDLKDLLFPIENDAEVEPMAVGDYPFMPAEREDMIELGKAHGMSETGVLRSAFKMWKMVTEGKATITVKPQELRGIDLSGKPGGGR